MSDLKNTIGLITDNEGVEFFDVVSALVESVGLKLVRTPFCDMNGMLGMIVVKRADQDEPLGLPPLSSIRVIITQAKSKVLSKVKFSVGAPEPYSGRTVECLAAFADPAPSLLGEPIAFANGAVVWSSLIENKSRHDSFLVVEPWIKRGQCVFNFLNGSEFMSLLPLLDWLRFVGGWREWAYPKTAACFMFDDPNLHSRNYGFIKFEALAKAGKRNRFHTSFATVPFDSYYVNRPAAQLFRENKDTISLLVHGNNHTYRELAGKDPSGLKIIHMKQALQRISRLEDKARIDVSRVMAPPHGVCSADTMSAMAAAGFEAVCVSHGSVWTGNRDAGWTLSLGSRPATWVAGLPVFPRFGMDLQFETKVLLAAYLHQPIVSVGHHWDLADGISILKSAAEFINGLSDVTWANLTTLVRNSFRTKMLGERMRVQPFARIIELVVPEGIAEIELDVGDVYPLPESVRCESNAGIFFARPSSGWIAPVTPHCAVRIEIVWHGSADARPAADDPPTPFRSVARRILSELRDRTMPYFPRRFVKQLR